MSPEPATVAPLVAWGETVQVLQQLGEPSSFLTAVETERAQRLRFAADRADFIAAHGLVRLLAAQLLGGAPGDVIVVQRCDRCGGGHGRPGVAEAPDLQVSWSHTGGFVAAIAGYGAVAVDVDHPPQPSADDALGRLALNSEEQLVVARAADPGLAFARYWVRKESLVKLGLCTLDTLASTGPDGLPVEPSWSVTERRRPPAWRRLSWRDWHLVEWSDRSTRTVGTAMAAVPPLPIETQLLGGAGQPTPVG
jgi:4'-phosphopantetheinyl transferase